MWACGTMASAAQGVQALVVIIAVLCGAELGGIAGIFLAVPTVGILMVVIKLLGGGREIVSDVLEPATPTATPIVPVEPRKTA